MFGCTTPLTARWGVQLVPAPLAFSYQVTSLPSWLAARMSTSPSPSMSSAMAPATPVAVVLTVFALQLLPSPAVFRYQTTVLLERPAPPTTSILPSPSMSAGSTEFGPVMPPMMLAALQVEPSPDVFSYQTKNPKPGSEVRTSRSPSPSTSAVELTAGAAAVLLIRWLVQLLPSPDTFSYQETLDGLCSVTTQSTSPSPSMSPGRPKKLKPALVPIRCSVKFPAPSFSYQASFWSLMPRAKKSSSPSPSMSATPPMDGPSRLVVMSGCATKGADGLPDSTEAPVEAAWTAAVTSAVLLSATVQ